MEESKWKQQLMKVANKTSISYNNINDKTNRNTKSPKTKS